MPELWRTVAGNDRYEVSSYGNVRNKDTGNTLKPTTNSWGYPRVFLCRPRRFSYVHILVCTAFHGPRPEGMLACHRNDDRSDSMAKNLYWGTRADNIKDSIKNGKQVKGEQVCTAKLDPEKVREMRQLRADTGLSYSKIGALFGVNHHSARLAVQGITWAHVK